MEAYHLKRIGNGNDGMASRGQLMSGTTSRGQIMSASSASKGKVVSGDGSVLVCAQLSCDNPQVSLGQCIEYNDLTTFSSLLADIACVDDEAHKAGSNREDQDFPFDEEHWINQPVSEEEGQLLLQMAVNQSNPEFTRRLVRAGARADMYSDVLAQAVIHSCILGDYSDIHLPILFEVVGNRADVNVTTQPGGQTALHLAAERGKLKSILFLLEQPGIQINAKDSRGGSTALLLAAKADKVDCVQVMLEHGADPDIKCGRQKVRDVIQERMPYFDIDGVKVVSRPRDKCSVSTLMTHLESRNLEKFLSDVPLVPLSELSTESVKGYTLLQKAAMANLPQYVVGLLSSGVNPNISTTENPFRPHLMAAYMGHHKVLKKFVEFSGKPKSNRPDVNFAVWSRDTKETVLHLVLKKKQRKALEGGIGSAGDLKTLDANYVECLNILLSKSSVRSDLSRVINKRDTLDNTALHYASQMWGQDVVTRLLELGANIGVRNFRGEIPLDRILPETLESFLDSCSDHDNHPLHQDFKVEFNYSWLAPPVDDYQSEEWDSERQAELEREGLPETETLWCMSKSSPHRHLLRHPTVTSFLWLKWQRIRRVFNRNIRMYLLFVTSLTWYIFTRFGGVKLNSVSGDPGAGGGEGEPPTDGGGFCQQPSIYSGYHYGLWYIFFAIEFSIIIIFAIRDLASECGCSSGGQVLMAFMSSWFELILLGLGTILLIFSAGGLWYVLTVLYALIAARELVQMAASLKRYFFSLENLLELMLLILLGVVLFAPSESVQLAQDSLDDAQTKATDCQLLRHFAALCLLLSWTEMIILVARHPRLSRYNVYISMFYKVLQTFLLFLLWYSFFIIAFALGFYIMLHKDVPGFVPDDDHYVYFDSPWTSLVKTSTMFVGELEFSDIPIDTTSVLSWLSFSFLLVFVFLIVVILMNLLNGLAVSDTGIIMQKAEIVSYIARVETISYLESVLLGDPFEFLAKWPPVALLAKLPSLALCNQVYSVCPGARKAGHALTGATGILLFYSLLPEKRAKFPTERQAGCSGCCNFTVEEFPDDIMQSARELALKKEADLQQFNLEDQTKQIMNILLDQSERIKSLEQQLSAWNSKK